MQGVKKIDPIRKTKMSEILKQKTSLDWSYVQVPTESWSGEPPSPLSDLFREGGGGVFIPPFCFRISSLESPF